MNVVPQVLIGSSSEYFVIAREVADKLSHICTATIWCEAYKPGAHTLTQIEQWVFRFDFGIFIFAPDDIATIRRRRFTSVRDNVLFEAGVFVGGLGMERTLIITVKSDKSAQRVPSDLDGFVHAGRALRVRGGKWNVFIPAKILARTIAELGPVVRNPHNEVHLLKTVLNERRIKAKEGYVRLGDLIRKAASSRRNPWLPISDPGELMDTIPRAMANDVYWWLVVDGVFVFHDITNFTDEESWSWKSSIPYVRLSERGVVLLNEWRRQ